MNFRSFVQSQHPRLMFCFVQEPDETGSERGTNNASPANASNNNAPSQSPCGPLHVASDPEEAFFPAQEEIPNDISNRDTLLVRGQEGGSTEGLDLNDDFQPLPPPRKSPLVSPMCGNQLGEGSPVVDDPQRGSAYYSSMDSFVTAPEGPLLPGMSPATSPHTDSPLSKPSSLLINSEDTLRESSKEEDDKDNKVKHNSDTDNVHRQPRPQTISSPTSPTHQLSLKRGSRMRDPVKDDDSEPEEGVTNNTPIEVLADVHVANNNKGKNGALNNDRGAAAENSTRPRKPRASSPRNAVAGSAPGIQAVNGLHNSH